MIGSIRRKIRIAWCFGVLWFLILLIFSNYLINPYPSNKDLMEKFVNQREIFQELANSFIEDKKIKCFYLNGKYITFDSSNKLDEVSSKKFKDLLKRLDVLMIERKGNKIYFQIWKSDNLFLTLRRSYKGVLYNNSGNLNEIGELHYDLKYLESKWYIYTEHSDKK